MYSSKQSRGHLWVAAADFLLPSLLIDNIIWIGETGLGGAGGRAEVFNQAKKEGRIREKEEEEDLGRRGRERRRGRGRVLCKTYRFSAEARASGGHCVELPVLHGTLARGPIQQDRVLCNTYQLFFLGSPPFFFGRFFGGSPPSF